MQTNPVFPPKTSTPKLRKKAEVENNEMHFQQALKDMQAQNQAMFASTINASRMPVPEPPIFNGDPMHYVDWNRSFHRFIDSNTSLTISDKLYYLRYYTEGEVRDIVSGYYSLDSVEAYNTAKGIIEERYGHPFRIVQAYRNKIAQWPKLKSNDVKGLQRFSDFLKTCQTTMLKYPSLSILNDYEQNKRLKNILPDWLARSWNREVVKYTEHYFDEFPPFSKFVLFVELEAKIASHPIAMDDSSAPSEQCVRERPQAKSYASKTHVANSINVHDQKECLLCPGQLHRLFECPVFKEKSVEDRLAIILANKRCFLCLNAGHIKDKCRLRISCRICNKVHNTLLHKEAHQPVSETMAIAHSMSCANTCTSMLVPVYLSNRSNQEILTYAMLDTQSSVSFITKALASKLTVIDPISTQLQLSTLTSNNTHVQCHRYDNLLVRGHNSSHFVRLPKCFSTESIPNQLARPSHDQLRAWKHLSGVLHEFPPVFDVDVGLLIGYDCPEALAPINSIIGEAHEPFAVKTKLGWSIVGELAPHKQKAESDVYQTFSCLTTSHCTDSKFNEIIPRVVQEHLEEGFADLDSKSHNDELLPRILSSNIKHESDNFYSNPLPVVQDKPPKLPNNYRRQALSRLNSLTQKLNSDLQITRKYEILMKTLLDNGDTEVVDDLLL